MRRRGVFAMGMRRSDRNRNGWISRQMTEANAEKDGTGGLVAGGRCDGDAPSPLRRLTRNRHSGTGSTHTVASAILSLSLALNALTTPAAAEATGLTGANAAAQAYDDQGIPDDIAQQLEGGLTVTDGSGDKDAGDAGGGGTEHPAAGDGGGEDGSVERRVWTVTFDANGGEMPDGASAEDYTESVTEDETPLETGARGLSREGWHMVGWSTTQDGMDATDGDGRVIEEAIAVPLDAALMNLSYKYIELAEDEAAADEGAVEVGGRWISLVGDGYAAGSVDGDGHTVWEESLEGALDGDSLTLYAQWERDEYTIQFDANGGSGEMGDQVAPVGEAVRLGACAYTRDGFELVGWNTRADGSGTAYDDGAEVLGLCERDGDMVSLFAQWRRADEGQLVARSDTKGEDADASDDGKGDETADEGDSKGSKDGKDGKAASQDGKGTSANGTNDAGDTADDGTAYYTKTDDGLLAVLLGGKAAGSEAAATRALMGMKGVSQKDAQDVASQMFAKGATRDGEGSGEGEGNGNEGGDSGDDVSGRSGDGTNIEGISVEWLTPDTVDDGDDANLYLRPRGEGEESMTIRLNYALSGEHDYNPGDIMITVPATIWHYRNGVAAGEMTIPYPEDPKTTQEFNYRREGNYYVITNTRRISAASKGVIDFEIKEVDVCRIVDHTDSNPFSATIDVLTHKGNTLSLASNSIKAQIDTEAHVSTVTKLVDSMTWVTPDEIPEEQRISGEVEYLLVKWKFYARCVGNTAYRISITDTVPDEYDGFVLTTDTGFRSDATGLVWTKPYGYQMSGTQQTEINTLTVAYPASSFAPNTQYDFHNSVSYTLQEVDSEVSGDGWVDEQQVTSNAQTASTSILLRPPNFVVPTGNFAFSKIGNDGEFGDWKTHDGHYASNDIYASGTHDWYGIYSDALFDVRDGQAVEFSYTHRTFGRLLPWTLEGDPKVLSNYGQNAVTMETYDTDDSTNNGKLWLVSGNEETMLELGSDYEYSAVEFPTKPQISRAYSKNLDENGDFISAHSDGRIETELDYNDSHIPVIRLEAEVGGEWVYVATVDWSSGSCRISAAAGVIAQGQRVSLPQGTTGTRTIVTGTNAAIEYLVRPIYRLLPGNCLEDNVDDWFDEALMPHVEIYNSARMEAYDHSGNKLVTLKDAGFDSLRGYPTDTWVTARKDGYQTGEDYDQRTLSVHYEASVAESSFISDQDIYEEALASGRITAEHHGVWYDLLPMGMEPVVSSIKLRDKDIIESVRVIRNWRGSGRTMLVVSALLTPMPQEYAMTNFISGIPSGNYYRDMITIEFDATYPMDALTDYGDTTHNVIAFESLSKQEIASIEHYRGEPDTPYGTNHTATAEAFADSDEQQLMVNLEPSDDYQRFVYAGCEVPLRALSAARTSLSKLVRVNDEPQWSDGLYYDDAVGNARDVFVGGTYEYQLRMMSEANTTTKDMVLFDSLENFVPQQGNDTVDINAPSWQGSFVSIDVSHLTRLGCAPVVYYSTVADLSIADETNPNAADTAHTDLTDGSIWTRSDLYTGSLSAVRAIAIDASKKADGTDFEIEALTSAIVTIKMRAPFGNEAANIIAEDGHAYNNAYLLCTSIDDRTGGASANNFVRKDYTKVGMKPMDIAVTKRWNDDGNRDGLRPSSVTVHLTANGQDTGRSCVLTDPTWSGVWQNVPYTDEHGEKIDYSVTEDAVSGYQFGILAGDETSYTVSNIHEPELINISGEKHWEGDENDLDKRPTRIRVNLLANGREIDSKMVKPDSNGQWFYTFRNLYKYEDGTEINYTVSEETYGYASTTNGLDITNTWHPYNDIIIDKNVMGATAGFSNRRFAIRIDLTDQYDQTVLTDYEWTTSDGRSGTFRSGDSIELGDDEVLTIHDVGLHNYRVSEASYDGYTAAFSPETGQVSPNAPSRVHVANTYTAKGYASLYAQKALTGRAQSQGQFQFEVRDEQGGLVRNSANRSDGSITLGTLTYITRDAGRTYTYRIREKNRGQAGYTYDSTEYLAHVAVTDNGDGTLSPSVSYQKVIPPASPNDEETYEDLDPDDVPLFENEYHATGSINLKARKELTGGEIADYGPFSFQLLDEDGHVLQTKQCTNKGAITFDPIACDEDDLANQPRYFLVREVPGSDEHVLYDDAAYGYSVTFTDEGNGQITTRWTVAAPVFADSPEECDNCDGTGEVSGDPCPDCLGTGEVTPVEDWVATDLMQPEFENVLRPGGLAISKVTTGSNAPNDSFTFHVQLVGDDIPDSVEYSIMDGTTLPSGGQVATGVVNNMLSAVADAAGEFFGVKEAYADIVGWTDYTDNGSSVKWMIEDDGTLHIEPISGDSGQIIMTSDSSYYALPWHSYQSQVTAVVSEGTIAPIGTCYDMFYGYSNMTYADLSHWDMSGATSVAYMFNSCSSLVTLDTTGWALTGLEISPPSSFGSRTGTYNMFAFCRQLSTIRGIEDWDVSRCVQFGYMFYDCDGLESLDLSNWDVSAVRSGGLNSMLYDCDGLTSITLSGWRPVHVLYLDNFVGYCDNLEYIDVSDWEIGTDVGTYGCGNETYTDTYAGSNYTLYLGNGCSKIDTIDMSGWHLGNASQIDSGFMSSYQYGGDNVKHLDMSDFTWDTGTLTRTRFVDSGWSSLETLDMSGWDMSGVTSVNSMFYNLRNIQSIDISDWTNTDDITTASGMFMSCPKLETITGIEDFDVPSCTDLYDMFYGDTSLRALDLSSLSAAPSSAGCMFYGCTSLEELDISLLDGTTNNMDATNMFYNCPSLRRVTLGEDFTFKNSYYSWPLPTPSGSYCAWAPEDGSSPALLPQDLADTYDGSTMAGTWVWSKLSADIEDGAFDVTIPGNSTVIIQDLPAGCAYVVSEQTQNGWVLTSQSNVSGEIPTLGIAQATFTNEYNTSIASAQIVGTKTMDGHAPETGEFSFELVENGTVIQTVQNAPGGGISFSPLVYTRNDVGEHLYQVREVVGNDANVVYDGDVYTVRVNVVEPSYNNVSAQVSYLSGDIEFENVSKTGTLTLTKLVTGGSEANADDEFDFTVRLTNRNGASLDSVRLRTVTVADNQGGNGGSEPGNGDGNGQDNGNGQGGGDAPTGIARLLPLDILRELFEVKVAYADIVSWSNYTSNGSTVRWMIDDNGVLTIEPTSGDVGNLNLGSSKPPWYNSRNRYQQRVTSVSVPAGKTIKVTGSYAELFYDMQNVTSIPFDSFDVSGVTNMTYFFYNCKKLTSVDLSSWYHSGITNMSYMFYGCSLLNDIDWTGWGFAGTTNMSYMFYNCSALPPSALSGFDTPSATNLSYMFYGCTSLDDIDFSAWDTSHVTNMAYMFYNCNQLTDADLSGWDTSHVTNMSYMFYGCSKLETLDVSGWDNTAVTSKTNMLTSTTHLRKIVLGAKNGIRGSFPATNNTVYPMWQGEWVNTDTGEGPLTTSELSSLGPTLTADQQGAWEIRLRNDIGIIRFYNNILPEITISSNDEAVTLSEYETTTSYTTGWRDPNTSTVYPIGEPVTGIVQVGNAVTLSSVYEYKDCITMQIWEQKANPSDGYQLVSSTTYYNNIYLRKDESETFVPDDRTDFVTPASQTVTGTGAGRALVVDFYYDRESYDVAFDGNGADSGSMGPQSFLMGVAQPLLDNVFAKAGFMFVGWATGADGEAIYTDAQSVLNLAADGETLQLYAKWAELLPEPTAITEGTYHAKLKANQRLEMLALPAGTTYEIVEGDLPSGWTQASAANMTGTISPNQTSAATVTNAYSATGDFTPQVWKDLVGRAAQDGEFSFQLLDEENTVLGVATNGDIDNRDSVVAADGESLVANPHVGTAPVAFSAIHYTEPGTHTYTVREVAGNDPTLTYDDSIITITVTVTDAGHGNLACSASYANGQDTFENVVLPGSLELTKQVDGSCPPGATFAFDVELLDSLGEPLSGGYTGTVTVAEADSGVVASGQTPESATLVPSGSDLVVFEANGGHFGASYSQNLVTYATRAAGSYVTAGTYMQPVGATSRKVFAGWYTDRACTSGNEFDPEEYAVTGGSQTVVWAKWDDVPVTQERSVSFADGHATITLGPGDSILVEGLPDGATYSISEREAPSWHQVGTENLEGGIVAGETAHASITNRYELPDGEFEVIGTKLLVGDRYLEGSDFSFEMVDSDGQFVALATNDAQGNILFSGVPVAREQVNQTLTYTIREVDAGDSHIIYDDHVETIQVTVTDAGGTLATAVSYDGDGVSFVNTVAPIWMPETGMAGLAGRAAAVVAVAVASLAAIEIERRRLVASRCEADGSAA